MGVITGSLLVNPMLSLFAKLSLVGLDVGIALLNSAFVPSLKTDVLNETFFDDGVESLSSLRLIASSFFNTGGGVGENLMGPFDLSVIFPFTRVIFTNTFFSSSENVCFLVVLLLVFAFAAVLLRVSLLLPVVLEFVVFSVVSAVLFVAAGRRVRSSSETVSPTAPNRIAILAPLISPACIL